MSARPLATTTVVRTDNEARVATAEDVKFVAHLVVLGSAETNEESFSDIHRRHAVLTGCVRGIAVTFSQPLFGPGNL